jgi:hypothetical protein
MISDPLGAGFLEERAPMRPTILAVITALSVGAGSALAASAPPNAEGYVYPDFWGGETTQHVPAAQPSHSASGTPVGVFATQSNHGVYLFPPNPNGNG